MEDRQSEVEPETFLARGWHLLLPSGGFFAFCALLFAAAPDLGGRIFYGFMALATGCWFFRCWRSAVVIDNDGLVFRSQARTKRLPWHDIASTSVVPVRTASPLATWFPYVCVGVELRDGRRIQFDDLVAPASRPDEVERVRSAIVARLPR